MSNDHADSVTSKRPYLIRAMHEWMSDNGHTPHLVVDALHDAVVVPSEHVKDGRIVLNISYTAAHALTLDNQTVSFRARFGGQPFEVSVPVSSVLGIYARETGQGMVFADGTEPDDAGPDDSGSDDDGPSKGPHLKVVK
ncbi:MAG: ClpXP protease specificity-enhancing factor [Pseudomonadota bacterium]